MSGFDPCPPDESTPGQSRQWCPLPRPPWGDGGCAWRPSQLNQAMRQQMDVYHGSGYNELIFEWQRFVNRLPGAVEAIFVRPRSNGAQRVGAYAVRRAFMAEYKLDEGGAPPMLLYDESDRRAPWRPA